MKLTKSKLQQIIREELEKLSIEEGSIEEGSMGAGFGTHRAGQMTADKQKMCQYANLQYEEGRAMSAGGGSNRLEGSMKMAAAMAIISQYGCDK